MATDTGIVSTLSAEDFETASIRSAAPSYVSDVPSYHSTVPNGEPIPTYSPPASNTVTNASFSSNSQTAGTGGGPSSSGLHQQANPGPALQGLPPVPSAPLRRPADIPILSEFRIPSWSTITANPTARHYHNVAHRRVSTANSAAVALEGVKRMVLDRIEEEERNRFRPLEDPYLVGEEAAARARAKRLARENGDGILIREDRRWDWFLVHMKDWDERERSWKQFRREAESGSRGKLARRFWTR